MTGQTPDARHATFNPAIPNDPEPGQPCEDCGQERWQHRDGGMVYGLICPSERTIHHRDPSSCLACRIGPGYPKVHTHPIAKVPR